jgi:hypothetical protein
MGLSTSLANRIIALSSHIDDWDIDAYYAVHKSGVAVWIANGYFGIDVAGKRDTKASSIHLGWWDSFKVWRAMKVLMARKIQAKLEAKGV